MILPGQFANEVREGESILFCPYCSRILFYEEVADEDQVTYYNDTGSLADSDDELEDEFEEDEDMDSSEYGLSDDEGSLADDDDDLDDPDSDSDE